MNKACQGEEEKELVSRVTDLFYVLLTAMAFSYQP